ncbi:MAG TPA: DNA-3-methyladenine glycosylase [Solirubrobacterales bacterium]|jgi:DNA-3-methyladenine glycosylase|nr:DNA-3-methyladenine glycosylase [Solirubrobacterales bacterium]
MPGIPAKGTAGTAGDLGGRLGVDFFDRSVHAVARELVGCRLFFAGVGGTIVETEAYEREDPASHSYVGLTERTKVMFGPPGRAYVYLSYGIHSLLNFVCEPEGDAAAVLIRALEPTAGLEAMRERRTAAHSDLDLCSGPGKLTEGLGITLAENADRLDRAPFLLLGPEGDPPSVMTSTRVGITKGVEKPWRFSAAGSPFVSRPRPVGPTG